MILLLDAQNRLHYFYHKIYVRKRRKGLFVQVTVPVTNLFTLHSVMVYVVQLSSRTRMERSSILVLLSTNQYDIYSC